MVQNEKFTFSIVNGETEVDELTPYSRYTPPPLPSVDEHDVNDEPPSIVNAVCGPKAAIDTQPPFDPAYVRANDEFVMLNEVVNDDVAEAKMLNAPPAVALWPSWKLESLTSIVTASRLCADTLSAPPAPPME